MGIKRLKIGIIGCGTIGGEMAIAVERRFRKYAAVHALCDIDGKKAKQLAGRLQRHVSVMDLDTAVSKSDFIIESASASISGIVLKKCVSRRKSCLIMSVGGLLGAEGILRRASRKGVKVIIPSGALCGVDGLKSSKIGAISSVTLTTRKPPAGLKGAPYIKNNKINLRGIKKETIIFEGSARDAVKAFPQNINVSAVLSLAGIGADGTRVRIITSPAYTRNIHEVEIESDAGRIFTRCENVPSRTNPKTSALAILSAIATLESALDSVRIGT